MFELVSAAEIPIVHIQCVQLLTTNSIPCPHLDYSPRHAAELFRQHLNHRAHEMFMALTLIKRRMYSLVYIAYGNGNSAITGNTEAVAVPFIANTKQFVLMHNHVNNRMMPSDADIRITTHVRKVATSVGKQLIDHLIVGNDFGWVSMHEKGFC